MNVRVKIKATGQDATLNIFNILCTNDKDTKRQVAIKKQHNKRCTERR